MRQPNLPAKALLATATVLSLALGASACGNNSSETEPAPTTKVNGRTVEVQDDGAVEIDGIKYLNGVARWSTTPSGSDYEWDRVDVAAECKGRDLVITSKANRSDGGASAELTPDHRACQDGTLSPGELTELATTQETQGD